MVSRREAAFGGAAVLAGLFVMRAGNARAAGTYPVTHTDAEWRKILSEDQFEVLRHEATERPYTSPLLKEHRKGRFACVGCGNEVFASNTKFESGTGWPSFWDALPGGVERKADASLGIERTAIACARCGGHLGHVFDDGPKPTGLRYCMNGVVLTFKPAASA